MSYCQEAPRDAPSYAAICAKSRIFPWKATGIRTALRLVRGLSGEKEKLLACKISALLACKISALLSAPLKMCIRSIRDRSIHNEFQNSNAFRRRGITDRAKDRVQTLRRTGGRWKIHCESQSRCWPATTPQILLPCQHYCQTSQLRPTASTPMTGTAPDRVTQSEIHPARVAVCCLAC